MYFNCLFIFFSYQFCSLGFYVTFNVVKLILIPFLKFQHVMVFNVCVNDTVQLLYSRMNSLVEELIMMSFDWSFDSDYCCDR